MGTVPFSRVPEKDSRPLFRACATVLLLVIFACGRKADPQPGALVRPQPITSLSGEIVAEGVHLAWTRPDQYLNGKRMDDLGGFLVFRGLPGEEAKQIARVKVEDRLRFQRARKFEYVDRSAEKGVTYYYRVISFTTDGYYSDPSNQVTVKVES